MARSERDRAALLDAAARHLDGERVYVDAVAEAERSLDARGLVCQRELVRMIHDEAAPLLLSPRVAAIASFEWG